MTAPDVNADVRARLLPCPFCGGSPLVRIPTERDGFAAHVTCRCGAQLYGQKRHFADEQEAIAAWNRRAAPARGMTMPRKRCVLKRPTLITPLTSFLRTAAPGRRYVTLEHQDNHIHSYAHRIGVMVRCERGTLVTGPHVQPAVETAVIITIVSREE